MTTNQMKSTLLTWYPWWNLEAKKPAQIAAMYQYELSIPEEKARKRYINLMFKATDLDMQATIWDAYVSRFEE